MNYFEPELPIVSDISAGDTKKWILDEPYTSKKKWVKEIFTKEEYLKNPNKHLSFHWIDDEFICGNPECKSVKVKCIWYHYDGIAMGVDNTFGEFYCPDCGKYTFVEYNRDSS